jgi:mannose-6-phosphate isomerase-like protein (cupin superfamily)
MSSNRDIRLLMKYNLNDLTNSLDDKPLAKMIFSSTEHLKGQVMRLRAGVQIPPCEMDNDVMFIIRKGKGRIAVENEASEISEGDCIIVPHQAESRSILADTDMEIIAVQGLSHHGSIEKA